MAKDNKQSGMVQSEIERVYESFRVEFAGYARKALNQDEEAVVEALQETLVRACLKQSGFDFRYGKSGLYAWLLAILRRVCQEARRRTPISQGFDDTQYEDVATHETGYDVVLDSIEREHERDLLIATVAQSPLSNIEWAVVTALRLGYSKYQIACDLNIEITTVTAHVRNSVPRLRQAATALC